MQAMDFILKPVNPVLFKEKLMKAIRRIERKQKEKRISIKTTSGMGLAEMVKYAMSEIVSRHLEIHTDTQVLCAVNPFRICKLCWMNAFSAVMSLI